MSARTIILLSLLTTLGLLLVFAATGAQPWVLVTLGAFALIEAAALALPNGGRNRERR